MSTGAPPATVFARVLRAGFFCKLNRTTLARLGVALALALTTAFIAALGFALIFAFGDAFPFAFAFVFAFGGIRRTRIPQYPLQGELPFPFSLRVSLAFGPLLELCVSDPCFSSFSGGAKRQNQKVLREQGTE